MRLLTLSFEILVSRRGVHTLQFPSYSLLIYVIEDWPLLYIRKNRLQQVSPLVLDLKSSNMAYSKTYFVYLGNSVTNKDYTKRAVDMKQHFLDRGYSVQCLDWGLGGFVKIKTFSKVKQHTLRQHICEQKDAKIQRFCTMKYYSANRIEVDCDFYHSERLDTFSLYYRYFS